jgi:UDP-GlcNAc3NAcA epimerase
MKVLSVVGNRPQFIKSAPLSVALREAGIEEFVLHTGQHYDPELSQVFFDELRLQQPRYALSLRTSDPAVMGPLIRDAIDRERPDWLLVYGDTNSTLAGAEAGRAAAVAVAHVEAGLRSGDLSMPEERTRIAVDKIARLLFCPDNRSRDALVSEGVHGKIEVVGDVMYDACLTLGEIGRRRSDALERYGVEPGKFVLVTVHREANVRIDRLRRIVEGLNRLDEKIVFPAHPRTRAAAAKIPRRFELTAPIGYLDMATLASHARVIITDSGGLQKEAYWYGVPCVTLRPSTEWIDTVEVGANTLTDDDPHGLEIAVNAAKMPNERPQLYGDGCASERIARSLLAEGPGAAWAQNRSVNPS